MNKEHLGKWLGVSQTTLSRWMLRYGSDFPILVRGSHGVEFKFDAQAVSDFLRGKQEQDQASKAEADEALAQLRLPFDIPGVEPPPKASSAKDELLAWELRKRQRLEAEAAGKLVSVEKLDAILPQALRKLGRAPFDVIRQIGREQNWPESFLRQVEKRLADQQRMVVEALRAELLRGGDNAAQ